MKRSIGRQVAVGVKTSARMGAVALALAVLASQAGAVTLRYKFKAGEVRTYKDTMKGRGETTISAMPEPMRMEMTGEETTEVKVLSTSKDGKSARIEQRVVSGKETMTAGGKTQTREVHKERVILTVTDRGKVLEVKTESADAEPAPEFGVGADSWWWELAAVMSFPEKDVKANETWDCSTSVDMGGAKQKVRGRSRLLKVLTYKGRPCAQIRTWFEMALVPPAEETGAPESEAFKAEGKLTGEITWYFDHVRGIALDQAGTVKMLMKIAFTMGDESAESSTSLVMNFKTTLVK